MSTYERFLGTVPSLAGCTRRELRLLSRHVDDVALPAGSVVPASEREVLVVARGRALRRADGSLHAITPVRLLVLGRRELGALLHDAPDLARRFLSEVGATRVCRVALPPTSSQASLKVGRMADVNDS